MFERTFHIRRCVATVALLGVGFATFEPVLGLTGDGAIHHDGAVEAAQHANSQHEENGHESGSDERGPTHQHGSSVDHCSHIHGPAVTTHAPAFPGLMESRGGARLEPTLRDQANPDPLFHPPRQ